MHENNIRNVDIDTWVEKAHGNQTEFYIRRVMRVILLAVSSSSQLKGSMVIKGGVLLSLGYGTDRYTKDVDFSTPRMVDEENPDEILDELNDALRATCREFDNELFCKTQKREIQPSRDSTFPTLRVKVGYAVKGTKEFQRMMHNDRPSTKTVTIDLSFNEKVCFPSSITMDDHEINAYSLYDQVAEKYRALIQQSETRRGRIRRQDVYDLFVILNHGLIQSMEDKETILEVMQVKFASRGVECHSDVIMEPDIRERARKEYSKLEDEIENELPDFEMAFEVVKEYFLHLPWDRSNS